jgi:hypothetical protein
VSLIVALSCLTVLTPQSSTGFDEAPGLLQQVERAERGFERSGDNFLAQAPRQQYSASFAANGQVTIQADTAKVDLKLTSFGFGADSNRTGVPSRAIGRDAEGWPKLTYSRPGIAEWYVNEKNALHHWMQIAERPRAASGNLWVKLSVSGADSIRSLSDESVEVKANGTNLSYRDLKVWDADARPVPARLEVSGQSIYFNVEDSGARYPITIDPIWTQEGKLTASDPVASDNAGHAVALDGDTAVVGSYNADLGVNFGNAGAVYVFTRTGTTWTQQAKLSASSPGRNGRFGTAVDIEGDQLIVGAATAQVGLSRDAGVAYVFTRTSGTWTQRSVLSAPDIAQSDLFGSSVAISGSTAVVGSPQEDPGNISNAGSAYVFTSSNDTWSYHSKLVASDAAGSDNFGVSVDILSTRIVVGASGASAAYTFNFRNPNWEQEAILVGTDTLSDDGFGRSVALNGDRCVVGANNADPNAASNAGAAYVFKYTTPAWSQEGKLIASDAAAGAQFGWDVAISGSTVAVGAYFADPDGVVDAGSAYVFTEASGTWTQDAMVVSSDKASGDRFGHSVDIDGTTLLAGAPFANLGSTSDAGAAYAFLATTPISTTVTFPTAGITGTKATMGTITFASPAVSNTVVSLSSNVSALIVPASATVLAGASTATFAVSSTAVTSDTTATVTASGTGITSSQGSLIVRTPRVGKVAYDKNSLIIGQTAIGTVTLQAVAPAGGTAVALTYSGSGITGPSSITIPAGASSGTFSVLAGSVGSESIVKTEAFPSFSEKSTTINVSPLVFGISSSRNVLLQGQEATGTLTLATPAPTGGLSFSLSSTQNRFTLPASVTVLEGELTATFPVRAGSLPIAGGAITATMGGLSQSMTISIIELDVQSVSLNPSTVAAGSSTTGTITLTAPSPTDTLVMLSLQKPTLASVPASILIPAGMLTGTFTVNTFPGKTGTFSVYGRIGTKGTKGTKITIN